VAKDRNFDLARKKSVGLYWPSCTISLYEKIIRHSNYSFLEHMQCSTADRISYKILVYTN
jgi:hypothetical protein